MPKITSGVASAPLSQVDTPLLAVAVAQSSAVPASLADLDRAAGGVVARVIASGDFKGKRDETTLLYLSGAKPGRVLLVDRKSTRLNSSHSQISYAVFCLKKKKKHSTPIQAENASHNLLAPAVYTNGHPST